MKMLGNFNKPIRLRKNILKTIVRLQGQSIYDEMSHNVVYLFSIYDEMSHNANLEVPVFCSSKFTVDLYIYFLFLSPSMQRYRNILLDEWKKRTALGQ